MYLNAILDDQDARRYSAAASEAIEALRADGTAMALIGMGALNGNSIYQTVSGLCGLMVGKLTGLPSFGTSSDAFKAVKILSDLRTSLEQLGHWNSVTIHAAINASTRPEVDLAFSSLLQSVGRPRPRNLDVSEIFLVIGKVRALKWIEQVIDAIRGASLIG